MPKNKKRKRTLTKTAKLKVKRTKTIPRKKSKSSHKKMGPVLIKKKQTQAEMMLENKTDTKTANSLEITMQKKTPAINVREIKISRHLLNLKNNNQPVSPKKFKEKESKKLYYQLLNKFQKTCILKKIYNSIIRFKKTLFHIQIQKHQKNKNLKSQPNEILSDQIKLSPPQYNNIIPTIQPPEIKIGKLILPSSWLKASLAFFIICCLLVLPFFTLNYYQQLQGKKINILQQINQALFHLTISQKAAFAYDLPNIELQLEQTAANFNEAKEELNNINIIVKSLIAIIPNLNQKYETATNLMSAGEKISSSAAILTEALNKIKLNKSINNFNLTNNLTILKNSLSLILPDLQSAATELNNISIQQLPLEYQTKIIPLQNSLPLLIKNLEYFTSISDLLLEILGKEVKKRYLVLFQNNNEIRPTGGFIGSYAIIDIDRGNVTKIDVPGGGPYDLKAGLKASIESPPPLHIVNDRWEFQDGNWFADLPTSAEKLSYLFEKSGGPTCDGMIFINATFIQNLLAIIGPIDLPQYQLQLNSSNFISTLQKEVEINYDKKINRPKQIIADLTPILINKLLQSDPQQLFKLLDLLLTSLNQKEIQLYFTDYDLENFINQNNWGGKLIDAKNDYLNIVSTNIAGEKTDAKIKQTAILNVEIQADGSIINNLTITKTHTGVAGEKFYGVANLDYLRIYVPKDSELLKAEGFYEVPPEFFIVPNHEAYTKDPDISLIEVTKKIDPVSKTEIFNEGNKTVFANWVKVEPGETISLSISYKLPFKLNLTPITANRSKSIFQNIKEKLGLEQNFNSEIQTYSLIWQKQSGKHNFIIHAHINFPQPLNFIFIYPDYIKKDEQNFSFTTELDTDKIIGISFKR